MDEPSSIRRGRSVRSAIAVDLVAALRSLGVCTPDALPVVTGVWEDFIPESAIHLNEVGARVDQTVTTLDAQGLVREEFSPNAWSLIHEEWTFPLHSVELTTINVEREALLDQRAAVPARQEATRSANGLAFRWTTQPDRDCAVCDLSLERVRHLVCGTGFCRHMARQLSAEESEQGKCTRVMTLI